MHARVIDQAAPSVILFPRLVPDRGSRLAPLGRDDALVELAPNVLLTKPAAAQAHLDALAELVTASRCYRLDAGADLDVTRQLVAGLIE